MIQRNPEQCYQLVARGSYAEGQCYRLGTVKEAGEMWCKQHVPSVTKARRAKSDREYEQRMARRQRARAAIGWDAAIKSLEAAGFSEAAEHLQDVQDNA